MLLLLLKAISGEEDVNTILTTLGVPEAGSISKEPCSYINIKCNEEGRILELHFGYSKLAGRIPHELEQLKHLQELRLAGNRLKGEIPKSLGNLQYLEDLDIGNNHLTGNIPIELSQLRRLKSLDLRGNQLTGPIPSELSNLTNLQVLQLSNNHLVGEIPKELGGLEQLTVLYLHDNQITGPIPQEFGRFKRIEAIRLQKNRLTGSIPIELAQLQTLAVLKLHHNQLTGNIPPELSRIGTLFQLELGQNRLTGEIPKEFGQLRQLAWLDAYQNRLTGSIPPELGQLGRLQSLQLHQNRLSGSLPATLGRLQRLVYLNLDENQLVGEIPREFGEMKELVILYLANNRFSGKIPSTLSRLSALQHLSLHDNQLTGEIPRELGQLHEMREFMLYKNRLSGKIPPDLRHLKLLQRLLLHQNQLTGEIPVELGQLKSMDKLHLYQNKLTGGIPSEICQLQSLKELLIQGNRLSQFPQKLSLPLLKIFDASRNLFDGPLVANFSADKLTSLDLSRNKFVGSVSLLTDVFCSKSPAGGQLRELRLNHNGFTGELPKCLLRFEQLRFLSLNHNQFSGVIPEIKASRLVVLSLHKNYLAGNLPQSLQKMKHLGVLTLHENWIGGSISSLNLSVPCLDNLKFRLEGNGCADWRLFDPVTGLSLDWKQGIRDNCPESLSLCPSQGFANVTLHHNRFSGIIPESISGAPGAQVSGTVLMGNMLGDGRPLESSWISTEESQPFLFYSPDLRKSDIMILTSFLVVIVCVARCHRALQERVTRHGGTGIDGKTRVVSSSVGLMKTAACAFSLAIPLLSAFGLSQKYFDSSPLLWQTTIAIHYAQGKLSDITVIIIWCGMQFFFRGIVASMPKAKISMNQEGPTKVKAWKDKLVRFAVWALWIGIVTALSLPSIIFTCAQSLPAQNTWDFNENILKWFHRTAPIQTVIIDMVLAMPTSSKFSRLTGIKADRLLMTFRLFSAWLVALCTTAFLDENCFGGWKFAWKVCQEGSSEHTKFHWKIYDEVILNPTEDLCGFTNSWWSDGRCSRAMVGSLTPFLLKKLLIRTALQPAILCFFWNSSRLEAGFDPRRGRHRRILGVWPRTTGSLIPLQQMALLTTLLELLIFWTPLAPLISVGVLTAAFANFWMFDLGLRVYEVELPSDEVNEGAALSKSYLAFAWFAGACFQLWHAFSARMFGRYALLSFSMVLSGPWARRFLPLGALKRHIWSEGQLRHQACNVEMTSGGIPS